jgi:hypothetical protein
MYACLFGRIAPVIKSIWWLILLMGVNGLGNSSTTMLVKFSNNS